MQLTTIVLGCVILGQLPASAKPQAAQAMVETPPDMVAEAMVLPPGHKLTGRPLTLLTAVSSVGNRAGQLEVVHAYWRLVEAVSLYHFNLDHDRRLHDDTFGLESDQRGLLRTARAASAAMVQESEAAAVAAQYELAVSAMLPQDAPLPLPADRPHVGPYVTHFSNLFAVRAAPAAARLIDRTLPIRQRAIDARASAVLATQDALSATIDAHRDGKAGFSDVLTLMDQCLRQQQALIRSVCLYNREVADYALTVVATGTTGHELVGMLIRTSAEPIKPLILESTPTRSGGWKGDSQVEPAGLNEPVPTPAVRPPKNVPTPAVRKKATETTDKPNVSESDEPALLEPPKLPLVPVEPALLEPIQMKVEKPLAAAPSEETAPALYQALLDASPGNRTKQLTIALHWDRSLPEGIGEPIDLTECLQSSPASDRQAIVEAYWRLRQRAAEYQVIVLQAELLDELILQVTQSNSRESLRLHSAKLTTTAAIHQSHAAVVQSQFALAERIGRASRAVWPMASTVPHCGPYLLKLDAQSQELVESWPLRRMAATIPLLYEGLRRHATAVVESDASRAEVTTSFLGGDRSIEQVLAAISRQTDSTFDFLQALTDYNRAIAQYAMSVLPPEASSQRVVSALVVP